MRYKRTLGDTGSTLLTELTRQRKRIFTFDDAARVYDKGEGGLRELLSSLVKKRWLQRIEKGKYLILPFEAGREGEWTEHEFIIASHLITPYYIGFRSALNYYGYTEQMTRTVFIVSTRRKLKSALQVSGVTYHFTCAPQRKFFGATEIKLDQYPVKISDREKTIIDCLDRLENCGGIFEVSKALWYGREELDLMKMAEYANRNGNKAASQRLGYLLESLGFESGPAIDILQKSISKSYAPLDTLAPRKGKYVQRWKIIVNVSDDQLQQWKVQ